MKKIIFIATLVAIISISFTSCKKNSLPIYQKKIISTDTLIAQDKNLTYPTFTGSDTRDDRFYVFSGSRNTDLSTMSGDDWTYEVWIKVDPEASIGDRTIPAGKDANGACIMERGKNFELYLINDADADFAIKYNRLDENNDAIGTMQSDNTTINLKFKEWAHIAISRSSADNTAKFYINGTLMDSSTDPLWIQPINDTWIDFNYMFRGGNINFYKGSLDNIRVSYTDRYPTAFEPNQFVRFPMDANTFLQLDLDKNLTPFDPVNNFDKIEIKGIYDYFIKVINTVYWTSENFIIPEG